MSSVIIGDSAACQLVTRTTWLQCTSNGCSSSCVLIPASRGVQGILCSLIKKCMKASAIDIMLLLLWVPYSFLLVSLSCACCPFFLPNPRRLQFLCQCLRESAIAMSASTTSNPKAVAAAVAAAKAAAAPPAELAAAVSEVRGEREDTGGRWLRGCIHGRE